MITRRISVRGIVLHEGKLLCARLNHYDNQGVRTETDFWCLPGGGLDDGEALLAGVERELLEETGVKPQVGRLLYVQQFDHGGQEWLEFFFHVTNNRDYLDIDLSKSSHGSHEIAEIDFVDPATVHVLPDFLATDDLPALVAEVGPVKVYSRL